MKRKIFRRKQKIYGGGDLLSKTTLIHYNLTVKSLRLKGKDKALEIQSYPLWIIRQNYWSIYILTTFRHCNYLFNNILSTGKDIKKKPARGAKSLVYQKIKKKKLNKHDDKLAPATFWKIPNLDNKRVKKNHHIYF